MDFTQDALVIAPKLLNRVLIRKSRVGLLMGRIVEVEAYRGSDDPASHAHPGPTPRSSVMFQGGGAIYVYRIYGLHHCFNLVTGHEGQGQAILIRALEPILGLERMAKRRALKPGKAWETKLCSGPAKICQSFNVDLAQNGLQIGISEFEILALEEVGLGEKVIARGEIESSPRIGIAKAKDFNWRFFHSASPFVSR